VASVRSEESVAALPLHGKIIETSEITSLRMRTLVVITEPGRWVCVQVVYGLASVTQHQFENVSFDGLQLG